LFVVLFVVGAILVFDGPSGDETPAKYISFYGSSSHRDKIDIGWLLMGLGLFFFLWFSLFLSIPAFPTMCHPSENRSKRKTP